MAIETGPIGVQLGRKYFMEKVGEKREKPSKDYFTGETLIKFSGKDEEGNSGSLNISEKEFQALGEPKCIIVDTTNCYPPNISVV